MINRFVPLRERIDAVSVPRQIVQDRAQPAPDVEYGRVLVHGDEPSDIIQMPISDPILFNLSLILGLREKRRPFPFLPLKLPILFLLNGSGFKNHQVKRLTVSDRAVLPKIRLSFLAAPISSPP